MYNVKVFGDYGDDIPRDSEGNIPEKGDRPEEFAYPVYDEAGGEVGDTHEGISENTEFTDWWLGAGFAEWLNSARLAVRKLVAELSEKRKNNTADEYDLEIIGNLISSNIIQTMEDSKMRSPEDIAKLITEDIRTNNGLVESLFGQNVVDGDKPIDMFLGAIDRNYLDLDFKNPKVVAIATKVFGT